MITGEAAMTDELDYYTTEGDDRDAACAIFFQSRLPHASRIDDIQVRHLLQIGYRAGRRVTEADTTFDRVDAQLGRWAIFAGGTALGATLTGVLSWIFG